MSRTKAYFERAEHIKEDPEAPLRRIFARAIEEGSTLSNPELFRQTLAALEKLKTLESAKVHLQKAKP